MQPAAAAVTPGQLTDARFGQQMPPLRGDRMKPTIIGTMAMLAAIAVAPAGAQTVPQIAFESVPNPLTLPPNVYFGEVSGVAVKV